MSDPFEKVKRNAARNSMLSGAVLVAVSGGADSVALLDMLLRLSKDAPRARQDPSAIRLHVAHLDHCLRGKESADDAEFVRALAQRLDLPFTLASADVRKEASRLGRGIEEVARELRYRFLLDAAEQAGCDRIATGHTMTDQAETFLMRLARGAGLRGLSSMRPVIAAHIFEDSEGSEATRPASRTIAQPLLVRPLLAITREEVEAYCRDRGLEYREDATNLGLDYTRNRIRNRVLPALAEINPRVVESLARSIELVGSDEDALEQIASYMLDRARVEGGPGVPFPAYSVRELLGQPLAIRRRMIVEAIRRLRSSQAEGRPKSGEITSKHIAAVTGLLDSATSGKRVELPGGIEVWREFDRIVFEQGGESGYELELSGDRPRLLAGGLEIVLVRERLGSELKALIEEAVRERGRTGIDWMTAVLDDRRLPEHLTVRPRRAGERASVLGQRQTKKLKNLMIGHKIPSSRREIWPVVATPDGLYIWSPGLPPAREFAARDETQWLAILRASDI